MGLIARLHARLIPQVSTDGEPLDRLLNDWDALGVLLRVSMGVLRGLPVRLGARHSKGLLLVGKGVTVTGAQHLTLGRGVKIEDHAEIQCRSHRGVVLGDGVTIGRNVSIRPSSYYGHEAGEGLTIGAGSCVGALSWIGASGHVTIGVDVMLGPRVTILPENHVFERLDVPIKAQGVLRRRVVIEDDCWIGAGATILSGVRIGRGSIVAAGAVVARSVPPRTVVGGIPARVLKYRSQTEGEQRLLAALKGQDPGLAA
ncbi:2,3,4,5-tetrahydropyridine-2,6-dicarboxylate N-acetyltransferase [Planctomycetes bacterium Poly30]|uniref:2,3,4,5-tetrahydropyridine-2,6-dicarboxylate N-acetyltransferase n=1 Tax=Saltatorellus ferox TaxID=2528018 RepID=A0A518ELZ9_9BACT|nr:2,3,4,5-tetrahydropyridine-2,6-dicarboxylate N-acetyltransferase [Planctomycetes bacterium Poly30]